MKTVNDYIAHYDVGTEVLIYADINRCQAEIYHEGTLCNVPEYLRSQDVLVDTWFASTLELIVDYNPSNHVVRTCFYGDDF